MKKRLMTIITAVMMLLSFTACGDDSGEVFENFKNYIDENGLESDYYIQISKTADSANTLIEASKLGKDCAFMESAHTGDVRFFRNGVLTEVSAENYFAPIKKDRDWNNFEYEGMSEKYRDILSELLKNNSEKTVEKKKNDNKDTPYSVTIKYDVEKLDTKALFSNSGNFGIVNIKFDTDEKAEKFDNISVSCQYDYDGVIYLHLITFGTPDSPDEKGNGGRRPEDIQSIFDSNMDLFEAQMAAT